MQTELEQLLQEVANIRGFVKERVDAGTKPLEEEMRRLATAMDSVHGKLKDIERHRALANIDGAVIVRSGKLTGFDLLDLRILERVMESRLAKGIKDEGTLAMLRSARSEIAGAFDYDAFGAWEDMHLRRRGSLTQARGALGQFREMSAQWLRALALGYTRALDSTTAAKGDELVPTFEAAELWMDVNLETQILPLIPQVTMPTNPFDIPIQFGDTNWYPISENVQVTTTDPATQKVTLTAQGLKTGVPFSDELEEDAVIALVPELRRNLVRNAAEVIDDVLLNGDTTTTNGINSDGATIAKTTAGKAHWLLGFDGLIHLPLIDNTAQRFDANTVVLADNFNRILARLAKYATQRREGEVVFVSDVRGHIRSMSIDEVETVDKAGGRATLSTGELTRVYGLPYIRSAQMRQADTDGKVTDTTATGPNTYARILAVNTTQWRVGFRRQITMETDREPGKGQTTLYVSFRIALTERSGTRSSATHTSLAYDITGT